jgi:hypothetical protein
LMLLLVRTTPRGGSPDVRLPGISCIYKIAVVIGVAA